MAVDALVATGAGGGIGNEVVALLVGAVPVELVLAELDDGGGKQGDAPAGAEGAGGQPGIAAEDQPHGLGAHRAGQFQLAEFADEADVAVAVGVAQTVLGWLEEVVPVTGVPGQHSRQGHKNNQPKEGPGLPSSSHLPAFLIQIPHISVFGIQRSTFDVRCSMFNVPFLLSLFPRDSLANRRRHTVAGIASAVASGTAVTAAGQRAIEAGCRYRQGADQEDG